MRNFRDGLFFATMAGVLLVGMDQPAHAYLDPGTGSMLFQAAAAGVLVVVVTLRTFWASIKAFLCDPFGKKRAQLKAEAEQAERDEHDVQ